MEVPRLGVQLELQMPAYTTATAIATPDPSCVCNLHHSSGQRQILNPLSKARDQTRNLMVPSWIRFHCPSMGIPKSNTVKLKDDEAIPGNKEQKVNGEKHCI